MSEDELVERIDSALTGEQIQAVRPFVGAWMKQHPNDRFDPSRLVWAATYKMQRREEILRPD